MVGSAAATQVIGTVPEVVAGAHRADDCWCGETHGRHLDGEVRQSCTADDLRAQGQCCEDHDPDAEDIQCCDDCPNEFEDPESVDAAREAAHVDHLDIHAALNTYEAPEGAPRGFSSDPSQAQVVGANGRRLIARWTDEGVWVGGCLIADREAAEALAAFITREADE